jgi:hypothetical protein
MTKRQRTNNDISNTTQKIKDLGTQSPQNNDLQNTKLEIKG